MILRSKRNLLTISSHISNKHNLNKVILFNNCKFCTSVHSEEPTNEHLKILNDNFGLTSFKKLQWKSINSILSLQDSFICLASGYGKSLCYQYPALYKNGLSIVFSPLISLMHDQVRLLEQRNISSCYLASIQPDKTKLSKMILNGHFNVVYITPETAFSSFGISLLNEIYKQRPITMFAVDEAHCILHWGLDFRPAYKKLTQLRTNFPKVPILALTATTTDEERKCIIDTLKMSNPQVLCDDFNRPNLYFMAKPISNEPIVDIMNAMDIFKKKFHKNEGSVLIYCITKSMTEKIANLLRMIGLTCQVYHSNMSREDRQLALHNFINNKFKVLVATTAFGMGINKPDISLVIHYGTSLNMEGYYQEAGRAGRDGMPAVCVLFYSPADFNTHRYLNGISSKSAASLKYKENSNNIMKKYVMTTSCRREFILSHFNSVMTYIDQENCCDNCAKVTDINNSIYDCSSETELFLKTMKSLLPKTYGIKTIVSSLLGVKRKNIFDIFKNNEYYGKGQKKEESWWKYLALHLETEKYIEVKSKRKKKIVYSNVMLADKGKHWLREKCEEKASPIFMKINE